MRILELLRPFRVVASRRVSEEEQVSVEVFARTESQALSRLENVLGVFRDHRKRSNEEVVMATRQQLVALDTAIKARGDEIQRLDEEIAKKKQHPLLRSAKS